MEAVSVAAAVQSQQKQWSGCHIMISAYRGNASYYNQLKPDPALFNWSALFHEKNLPTTDLESLLQDIIG